MTQEQKNIEFKKITDKMLETYQKKNEMYGDSYNKTIQDYGLIAGLGQLAHKFRRIESIIMNPDRKVNYESLEDTLLDLANYLIITKLSLDEINEKSINKIKEDNKQYPYSKIETYPKSCQMCPHYSQPYWNIISPCKGCPNEGLTDLAINTVFSPKVSSFTTGVSSLEDLVKDIFSNDSDSTSTDENEIEDFEKDEQDQELTKEECEWLIKKILK